MGGKKFLIRMSWRENLFTFLYANLSAYLDPYKSLIFRPLWSQKEPSMKVPGFLFSRAFKIYFDKRLKIKNPITASAVWVLCLECPMRNES